METVLGIDSCGKKIIPISDNITLRIFTNCHPNVDGTSWGWIEGCTLNICWSDDDKFTREKATELVNDWNNNIKE